MFNLHERISALEDYKQYAHQLIPNKYKKKKKQKKHQLKLLQKQLPKKLQYNILRKSELLI